MEKKQNIQNRIEEVYNGKKKIPFMQSKDILQYQKQLLIIFLKKIIKQIYLKKNKVLQEQPKN